MVLDKFKLNNAAALVTGGAGLLGQKHCEALLEAGAIVCIVDINPKSLKEIYEKFSGKYPGKIYTYSVDITDEKQLLELQMQIITELNSDIQILINNAAIDPKFEKGTKMNHSRLENFSLEQWNKEISVGLTGALLCAKVFGAKMAKKGSGIILNIASDLGVIAPNQNLYKNDGVAEDMQNVKPVTYSVIKHGLIGLTKYLSTYWADQGVRCNALAPGGVFNNHDPEFVQKISSLIPMGRMAEIDEYKAAVVFLCSEASSYMNGATIIMDGGRSVW